MSTEKTTNDAPSTLVTIGGRRNKIWRSLEEYAATDEFRTKVETEFPSVAAEILDPFSRRTFLKFMGASLALAGVTGVQRLRRRR